jgi:hypothetical protein
MDLTFTEITIHKKNQSPIFSDGLIRIQLQDEGAGIFVKITQYDCNDLSSIRIDFEEVDYLVRAINMLRESLGDQIE